MLQWGRCRTPCSSKIRGDCYMRNMKWRTLRRFVHCILRPIQFFNLKSVFAYRFLRYRLERRASTRFGWEWSIKHSFILSIYVPAVPRLNPSLYFVTENGGIQKKVHVAYECCDFLCVCDHAYTWMMLNALVRLHCGAVLEQLEDTMPIIHIGSWRLYQTLKTHMHGSGETHTAWVFHRN